MEFVVKRSKWLRGNNFPHSVLLNGKEKMCCLGFLARASGSEDKAIFMESYPEDVPFIDWPKGILNHNDANTELTGLIVEVNDENLLSDAEREEKLTKLFASIGIQVKFED